MRQLSTHIHGCVCCLVLTAILLTLYTMHVHSQQCKAVVYSSIDWFGCVFCAMCYSLSSFALLWMYKDSKSNDSSILPICPKPKVSLILIPFFIKRHMMLWIGITLFANLFPLKYQIKVDCFCSSNISNPGPYSGPRDYFKSGDDYLRLATCYGRMVTVMC